jgi:hypothetical protein
MNQKFKILRIIAVNRPSGKFASWLKSLKSSFPDERSQRIRPAAITSLRRFMKRVFSMRR